MLLGVGLRGYTTPTPCLVLLLEDLLNSVTPRRQALD